MVSGHLVVESRRKIGIIRRDMDHDGLAVIPEVLYSRQRICLGNTGRPNAQPSLKIRVCSLREALQNISALASRIEGSGIRWPNRDLMSRVRS